MVVHVFSTYLFSLPHKCMFQVYLLIESVFLFRPVNFFSKHNRYTIAVTFGATASTCASLFVHAFFDGVDVGLISLTGPPWVKGKQ